MLLRVGTLILVMLSLGHLWLQIFNRFLLLMADSRRKSAWIQLCFVGIVLLPASLLIVFFDYGPVRKALAWEPHTTGSRLVFAAFGILWLLGIWRGGVWLAERFYPVRSRRAKDRIMIPSLPCGTNQLPAFLGPLETTYDLELVEREIEVPGLPPEFDGLTIAHVADLHYDPRVVRGRFYGALVRLVNSQQADLVVFTGDFVNEPTFIRKSVQLHACMKGRFATLCVFGNHDYWTNPRLIREECRRHGIRLMHNRRWSIGRGGRRLIFAGTDSPWGGEKSAWASLLDKGPGEAVVLLSHTPDNAGCAARHGANLILSGHNHGGQFCLPLIGPLVVPSRTGHRYAHGVYDIGDECVLSVSRGIGTSSIRPGHGSGRILCPPEIIIYTLRASFADVAVPVVEEQRGEQASILSALPLN